MTGSSTQGIKTVLHPVSDLERAKQRYGKIQRLRAVWREVDKASAARGKKSKPRSAGAGRRGNETRISP